MLSSLLEGGGVFPPSIYPPGDSPPPPRYHPHTEVTERIQTNTHTCHYNAYTYTKKDTETIFEKNTAPNARTYMRKEEIFP